jgi:hypothetical protein
MEKLKQFAEAVRGFDRFEIVADGAAAASAVRLREEIIKRRGSFCSVTNSEEFAHIGMMYRSPKKWGEIFIILKSDPSFNRTKDTLYGVLAQGRTVLVLSDASKEELTAFRLRDGSDVKSVYKPDGQQQGVNKAEANMDKLFVCSISSYEELDASGIAAELSV